MNSEVAERYGQGLFELAEEENTVSEKKDIVEKILQVMDENPDVEFFFRAVKVTDEEKKNFIDEIFERFGDHEIVSFMKLIIDKGRAFWMQDILKAYVKLANEYLGIETGVVSSARKLDPEDMEKIREALEKKTGKKVVLTNKIDPSLIAGIRVSLGSHVTDMTMKTRIEDMRSALLKGGQA